MNSEESGPTIPSAGSIAKQALSQLSYGPVTSSLGQLLLLESHDVRPELLDK
jgi:hypothetical protein